jgi:vacuolar-type H+-ATPase subunit E/Vma4
MANPVSPKKSDYKKLKPDQIPEVMAYQEAKQMLDLFDEANRDLIEARRDLLDDVEQKAQKAIEVVRSQEVSCGDFKISSVTTAYNIEDLRKYLGDADFLRLGGTYATQTVFDFDRTKLESLIKSNQIPATIADAIRKVTLRYSQPKIK